MMNRNRRNQNRNNGLPPLIMTPLFFLALNRYRETKEIVIISTLMAISAMTMSTLERMLLLPAALACSTLLYIYFQVLEDSRARATLMRRRIQRFMELSATLLLAMVPLILITGLAMVKFGPRGSVVLSLKQEFQSYEGVVPIELLKFLTFVFVHFLLLTFSRFVVAFIFLDGSLLELEGGQRVRLRFRQ